jgi:hypothetical protein
MDWEDDLGLEEWPKAGWFAPADVPYLAAVGALTLVYAALEDALQELLSHYLSALPRAVRNQIVIAQNNKDRTALLRVIATECEQHEQIQDRLNHFLRGFSICGENRNLAAHAWALSGRTHFHLYKRSSSSLAENNYPLTLEELRAAVDSAWAFRDFGNKLQQWRYTLNIPDARPAENWFIGPRLLPDKPPLPTKLNPHPPGSIHPDAPIPL